MTQLPLEITIPDFWQMIAEQGVKVIVQLERHVSAQLCLNVAIVYWNQLIALFTEFLCYPVDITEGYKQLPPFNGSW